jgi:hypothetical protein
MNNELRKQLAVEFMQRTADGTLAQAAKRLLTPGGIHHDWRFPAGWDSFLKAVGLRANASQKCGPLVKPSRRIRPISMAHSSAEHRRAGR